MIDFGIVGHPMRSFGTDEERAEYLRTVRESHEAVLPDAERAYDEACEAVTEPQAEFDRCRKVLDAVLRERSGIRAQQWRESSDNSPMTGFGAMSYDSNSAKLRALDEAEAAAREDLAAARRVLEAAFSKRGDAGRIRDMHRMSILGSSSDLDATEQRIERRKQAAVVRDRSALERIRDRVLGAKGAG